MGTLPLYIVHSLQRKTKVPNFQSKKKKKTLTQKGSHNYIARLYIVPRLRTHTHRQKKIKKVTQQLYLLFRANFQKKSLRLIQCCWHLNLRNDKIDPSIFTFVSFKQGRTYSRAEGAIPPLPSQKKKKNQYIHIS